MAEPAATKPEKKYKIVEFFGQSSNADTYRPFTERAKPLSRLFWPFQRPFEPCRLPFESTSLYGTSYTKEAITGIDRSYIGAWANRDRDETFGFKEPLDVTSTYVHSYRNPKIHINPFDRALDEAVEKSFEVGIRPYTAPFGNQQVATPKADEARPITAAVNNNNLPVNQRQESFLPYRAVVLEGKHNYTSEYSGQYRDFSGIKAFCGIQKRNGPTFPPI